MVFELAVSRKDKDAGRVSLILFPWQIHGESVSVLGIFYCKKLWNWLKEAKKGGKYVSRNKKT